MIPLATEDFGIDYFNTRLNIDVWEDAESTERFKALCEATRAINLLPFLGSRNSDAENCFPRNGDAAIPTAVMEACCEEALQYLEGREPEMEMASLTMSSQGFANVRSTHRGVRVHTTMGILSERAWQLMSPYLRDLKEMTTERVS